MYSKVKTGPEENVSLDLLFLFIQDQLHRWLVIIGLVTVILIILYALFKSLQKCPQCSRTPDAAKFDQFAHQHVTVPIDRTKPNELSSLASEQE